MDASSGTALPLTGLEATPARRRRLARIVLNDVPGPPVGVLGDGGAAEELARAMLRAFAVHTNDEGRVAYRRLAASREFGELVARARGLRDVAPARLASREARLAFWINVYNALALHGVVALGVRRSVWEVWNFFGRVSYRVGAHVLSLDEIEHGILRGNARRALPPWPPFRRDDPRRALAVAPVDPRIHCALNCGARSCPPVGVYRAAAIDEQLDVAARNFVNQDVRLDAQGRIACSRIFKWYGRDFGSRDQLTAFLLRYLDDGAARVALASGRARRLVFHPYSWALPHPPAEP